MKDNFLRRSGLRLLLGAALVVQIITAITAIGGYHPDQHFQIIELSSYQLKMPSASSQVWELGAHIRPTLQIYLFSGYYLACEFFHLHDPYIQLMILRILFGLVMWSVFNSMALYYFKEAPGKTLYGVLLILNFSWIFPYTRTLFSSEMMCSLFFFGAVFLYDRRRLTTFMTTGPNGGNLRSAGVTGRGNHIGWAVLTGFLFSLAFYFRFQIGFAIAGFFIWMLLLRSERKNILPMAAGLLAGICINICLDRGFYHEWVFTPYDYFHSNISEGKAAALGTSSIWIYVGVLVSVITVPPLSLILLYTGAKSALWKIYSPYTLAVILFLAGHFLVAHKEERFLFPVLPVLPIFIGWGLPGLLAYYGTAKTWIRGLLKGSLIFSAVLNMVMLLVFMVTPYAQTVYFSCLLSRQFPSKPVTVYYLVQSPYETESRLQLTFYKRAAANIGLQKITIPDTLFRQSSSDLSSSGLPGLSSPASSAPDKDIYIATTYNHISGEQRSLLGKAGYRPVRYSSKLLWSINEFLGSHGINTINDIWVLYKKEYTGLP